MLYNSGLRTLVRIVEVSVLGESIFEGSTVFLFPAQKEEGYYVYNYKLMLNVGVNSSLGLGLQSCAICTIILWPHQSLLFN